MGHKWKGTVEARKLRFLELYEDGASYQEIMTQLGLDEHDLRDWRATIRILGVSRFLMSHTVKTTYSYETKLAAVKARVEESRTKTSWLHMALLPSFFDVGARFIVNMAKQVCNRRKGDVS